MIYQDVSGFCWRQWIFNAPVASSCRDPSKMQHSDRQGCGISICWQISWWLKWVFLWMNMEMVNMNVDRLRHRYRNLSSLLPLFVTHYHTAFLIFPDAPCKLSVLKVLPCSSLRPRKDWVATEESFHGDPTFLASWTSTHQRLLEDNFSILQRFFCLKVLQHIHLCMLKPPNESKQRTFLKSLSPKASMHAAFRGHVTCLELLIESGAQVDPEVTICDNLWWVWGWLGEGGLLL